jgi:hypothetical protein
MATAGRTPFANGSEVEMFRANRCASCVHREPDYEDCEQFALPVALGEWPDLLVEVERTAVNPLGIECTRFETA